MVASRRRSDTSMDEGHMGKKMEFDTEVLCINTIRALGADQPQEAKSGHPGAPMGCAPMAHCLYAHCMKYSSQNPTWMNRDRFVLSNGHACALLYSMLHLTGHDVTLNDLKQFRQLNSKTPGHPECGQTPGVEVTTGPLGQGISNAVGLAIAAHHMAAVYNRPNFELFDNYIYCIFGDGCLQEGVSSEASSLAGHLHLGKLIVLYDSNKITIDGSTDLSFTENVLMRYESYGWHTQTVANGNTDLEAIMKAVTAAKAVTDKPSIIEISTTIAYGSKNAGSEKTHGAPLGVEDINAFKTSAGLLPSETFQIPEAVKEYYTQVSKKNEDIYMKWTKMYKTYCEAHPELGKELERVFHQQPKPEAIAAIKDLCASTTNADSTRALSGKLLNAIKSHVPEMIGGSADLSGSNSVVLQNEGMFQSPCSKLGAYQNRYIHFGVREHAMSAICNGMAAYGGLRPFCATFLNFITYAWGAVRLSALSHLGCLYIATHDSIELGEDGPTHQPVEVLNLLRSTPNLVYFRPADINEVGGAYKYWLENPKTPIVMCLCRASTPKITGSCMEGITKGAYVAQDFEKSGKPKVILAGSGTELQLCISAKELLASSYDVRIVSMPSWNLFNKQSEEYKKQVLCTHLRGKEVVTAYVEASSEYGWGMYFDVCIGMTTFGASGPKSALWKHFGFTAENVASKVKKYATDMKH